MKLLEIVNTRRILNRLKPTLNDVVAVHYQVELTSEWVGKVPIWGNALYDPATNRYLSASDLQTTGEVSWVDAVDEVLTEKTMDS